MTDPHKIANSLTKVAKGTIVRMRPDWCCSFNAQGHGYLIERGLVEHISGNCGRLTLLGLEVKRILKEQSNEH